MGIRANHGHGILADAGKIVKPGTAAQAVQLAGRQRAQAFGVLRLVRARDGLGSTYRVTHFVPFAGSGSGLAALES